jgi:hypothetical protein
MFPLWELGDTLIVTSEPSQTELEGLKVMSLSTTEGVFTLISEVAVAVIVQVPSIVLDAVTV